MVAELIVYSSELLAPTLEEMGLKKEGRHWYSDELGIVIEALASFLDPAATERVTQVVMDDLIIERIKREFGNRKMKTIDFYEYQKERRKFLGKSQ